MAKTKKNHKKPTKETIREMRILDMVKGIEHDLEEIKDKLWPERNGAHVIWLEQPMRVTADQAKSMSETGGWVMAQDVDNGWLFIGNLEGDWNEWGNGCWHDEKGNEVHS